MSRLTVGGGSEQSSDWPFAAAAKYCRAACWMKRMLAWLLAKPKPKIGCRSFRTLSEHMHTDIGQRSCVFDGACRLGPINQFSFRTGGLL